MSYSMRKYKLEHVAINVANPAAVAAWYRANLGLEIVREAPGPHHTHFLADSSGNVMLEIYNNPPNQVPDYFQMNPLLLHLAFVSEDPETDKAALLEAGAHLVEEVRPTDGSVLLMLRDPWGLPIQLCKRTNPMLAMQR